VNPTPHLYPARVAVVADLANEADPAEQLGGEDYSPVDDFVNAAGSWPERSDRAFWVCTAQWEILTEIFLLYPETRSVLPGFALRAAAEEYGVTT
jgi:hypothetical protein